MAYEVFITKLARKQISKLPEDVAEHLLDLATSLAANPRPHGSKKLVDQPGYRVGWGDYRLIYQIKQAQLLVVVVKAAHRRHVYDR